MQIFVEVVAIVAVYELLRLTEHNDKWSVVILFYASVVAILLLPLYFEDTLLLTIFLAMLGFVVGMFFIRKQGLWFWEGAVYIGIPLAALLATRLLDNGQRWILVLLAGTWTTDTMALFGGKRFGKTPLTRISPKKTREGTAIGVASAFVMVIVFGVALDLWQDHSLTILLAALILPPLAVFGDLLESKIKRTYGKKDSGSLLPGHGGILDRIDSTLLTAPALWALIVLFA